MHLVRTGLKISPRDLDAEHVDVLIRCLDDDGLGTIDLAELCDFVEFGPAVLTHGADPLSAAPPKGGKGSAETKGTGVAAVRASFDVQSMATGHPKHKVSNPGFPVTID